jgi:PIN domain nuclease of toxin-antitoxin system
MILLDTHIAIWLLVSPRKLTLQSRAAIRQARLSGEKIACAAVSLFEIAYLVHRNRISLREPPEDFIAAMRKSFEWVPVTADIALRAAGLPAPFHGDPMDRMIAGTALAHDLTLITADEKILSAKVCKTLW